MAMLGCCFVVAGSVSQALAVSLLPFLLLVVGAAWLPEGPPPTTASALAASALSIVNASIYVKLGLDRWRQAAEAVALPGEASPLGCNASDPSVHLLRASTSFVWAAGFVWLAADVLRWRCARFWSAIRLVVGICSSLRLGANLVLHYAIHAPHQCFVPGNVSFRESILFNSGCIVLAAAVLSLRSRSLLSEWTGGACVVLSLSEVHALPKPAGDAVAAADDDRSSDSRPRSQARRAPFPAQGMPMSWQGAPWGR